MREDQNSERLGRDRQIVDYLLDRLAPDVREQFETDMMADPALFELVEGTEEDLLVRYVRGGLAPAERSRIELLYSDPPRSERLEEARAFSAALQPVSPVTSERRGWLARWTHGPTFFRLLLAGATIAAGLLVVFNVREQRPQQGSVVNNPVAIWILPEGRHRGPQQENPSFQRLEQGAIRMEFSESQCVAPTPCRVEIFIVESDAPVWTGEARRSSSGVWFADVPTSTIQRGDHIAEVTAEQGGKTSYPFRVQ